jgi:hypothetical protein
VAGEPGFLMERHIYTPLYLPEYIFISHHTRNLSRISISKVSHLSNHQPTHTSIHTPTSTRTTAPQQWHQHHPPPTCSSTSLHSSCRPSQFSSRRAVEQTSSSTSVSRSLAGFLVSFMPGGSFRSTQDQQHRSQSCSNDISTGRECGIGAIPGTEGWGIIQEDLSHV